MLPLVHSVEDVWFAALEDVDDNRPDNMRFRDYVTETWVESDVTKYNHFNNDGGRTTNYFKEWHSRLNRVCK